MGNAMEAMRDSAAKELTVSVRDAEDNMVAVNVSDTGPGISEDVAAQLFQPFVTTKPGGMGIGLSISKRIIESHGGAIGTTPNNSGGVTRVHPASHPGGASNDGRRDRRPHGG